MQREMLSVKHVKQGNEVDLQEGVSADFKLGQERPLLGEHAGRLVQEAHHQPSKGHQERQHSNGNAKVGSTVALVEHGGPAVSKVKEASVCNDAKDNNGKNLQQRPHYRPKLMGNARFLPAPISATRCWVVIRTPPGPKEHP